MEDSQVISARSPVRFGSVLAVVGDLHVKILVDIFHRAADVCTMRFQREHAWDICSRTYTLLHKQFVVLLVPDCPDACLMLDMLMQKLEHPKVKLAARKVPCLLDLGDDPVMLNS